MVDREAVIQWYPGHMAQAMRRLEEKMPLVDIVIEVLDARVARASANANLQSLIGKRKRLIVLSREDLAEEAATNAWAESFKSVGIPAVAVNGKDQQSVGKARYYLGQLSQNHLSARALVLGIPNTGKSSIINGLLGRAVAKTEDRAGVTRQVQWFRLSPRLELMDTPGILVPKIETPEAQWKLAITGAIPRERYDPEDVVARFNAWVAERKGPRRLIPEFERFVETRGFLRKGGEPDLHNAALSYIKDFNDGKFGRITLEETT